MSRTTIGVICGGRSAEHEVSLQSARNIVEALDSHRYQVLVIGVDPRGTWWLYGPRDFLANPADPSLISLRPGSRRVLLSPWPSEAPLIELESGHAIRVDVFFPIIHGPLGEDGTLQGLLRLAGVPFVGADVAASAICMDKEVCGKLLAATGIPTARSLSFRAGAVEPDWEAVVSEVGSPVFVKPARQGSSVGVSRATTEKEFQSGLRDALRYDSVVLIQEEIRGQEVECSVLGNEKPEASVLGEIRPTDGFYSYEAKYLDDQGADLIVPAALGPSTTGRVQKLAVEAYQAVGCEGLARIDFFVEEDGRVVVNEINTLPGFTDISMYPRLWQASEVSNSDLVDRLVELALERERERTKLSTSNLGLG